MATAPSTTGRPNELAPIKALGVKRQTNAVMPEDFYQIAFAPAKT